MAEPQLHWSEESAPALIIPEAPQPHAPPPRYYIGSVYRGSTRYRYIDNDRAVQSSIHSTQLPIRGGRPSGQRRRWLSRFAGALGLRTRSPHTSTPHVEQPSRPATPPPRVATTTAFAASTPTSPSPPPPMITHTAEHGAGAEDEQAVPQSPLATTETSSGSSSPRQSEDGQHHLPSVSPAATPTRSMHPTAVKRLFRSFEDMSGRVAPQHSHSTGATSQPATATTTPFRSPSTETAMHKGLRVRFAGPASVIRTAASLPTTLRQSSLPEPHRLLKSSGEQSTARPEVAVTPLHVTTLSPPTLVSSPVQVATSAPSAIAGHPDISRHPLDDSFQLTLPTVSAAEPAAAAATPPTTTPTVLNSTVLLYVERSHSHDVPVVYHQGVRQLAHPRSVPWREVVARLCSDDTLAFYIDSTSTTPMYSVLMTAFDIRLSFYSPLDRSLAVVVNRDARHVEAFIFQTRRVEQIEQWYMALRRFIWCRAPLHLDLPLPASAPPIPPALRNSTAPANAEGTGDINDVTAATVPQEPPALHRCIGTSVATTAVVVVAIPDISARVELVLNPELVYTTGELRALVLKLLMGQRIGNVASGSGDTPLQARIRREELAMLWRLWRGRQISLAWRRWYRLEWPALDRPASITRALEQTHMLELRRASHANVSLRCPDGSTRPTPPEVEGCLLRVVNKQRAFATSLSHQPIRMRRLYLATRDRYLFITTPARLAAPQLRVVDVQERAQLDPIDEQPTDADLSANTVPLLASEVVRSMAVNTHYTLNTYGSNNDNHLANAQRQPRARDTDTLVIRHAAALVDLTLIDRVEVVVPTLPGTDQSRTATTAEAQSAPVFMAGHPAISLPAGQRFTEPASRAPHDWQHRVDLWLKDGALISLLAESGLTARIWRARLEASARFWQQYAEQEKAMRYAAAQATGAFKHQFSTAEMTHPEVEAAWPSDIRYIGDPQDYETMDASVDARWWPICSSLGCQPIVYAGTLYCKTRRRQPAVRLHCLLTRDGYLCYFQMQDAARLHKQQQQQQSNGPPPETRTAGSAHLQRARGRTNLHHAYVYSGYRGDQLERHSTRYNRPTSRYLGRGIYTRDTPLSCTFTVWLPLPRHCWHTKGRRGRCLIFTAPSRLETEAWVGALQNVIERLHVEAAAAAAAATGARTASSSDEASFAGIRTSNRPAHLSRLPFAASTRSHPHTYASSTSLMSVDHSADQLDIGDEEDEDEGV